MKPTFVLIAAAVLWIAAESDAFAALQVTIKAGTQTRIFVDGSTTPPDLNSTVDELLFAPADSAATAPTVSITTLEAKSNAQLMGSSALATFGTLSIKNNTSSTQTVDLLISGNGFNAPVGQVIASSGWSITLGSGTFTASNSTIASTAYYNSNNQLATLGDSYGVTVGSTPLQSYNLVSNNSANSMVNVTIPAAPFTTNYYLTFTLPKNATINLTGSQTLSVATPEPASLAAWGGMGLFGLVMAARRRKQK
jgi:MYXO-CTERM domain-containing protein